MAGDFADWLGRRATIIGGCLLFSVGVALQVASHGLGLLVAGRLVAGFGVGFVTAIIILYMSEIAPRKVRGSVRFFIPRLGLWLTVTADRQVHIDRPIDVAKSCIQSLAISSSLLVSCRLSVIIHRSDSVCLQLAFCVCGLVCSSRSCLSYYAVASGVDYATQGRPNASSYRIPIGIQFVWAAM